MDNIGHCLTLVDGLQWTMDHIGRWITLVILMILIVVIVFAFVDVVVNVDVVIDVEA